MGQMTLLITGASGFIGGHVVAAALDAGHAVRAAMRRPAALHASGGLSAHAIDLADPAAAMALDPLMQDVDAVIHLAAAMGGTADQHARDTTLATDHVLHAVKAAGVPHVVLISSLAVYDVAGLPDGATLDEDSPLEAHPRRRDAYCQAKLHQEVQARQMLLGSQTGLTILRPGIVWGAGRLYTPHLGPAFGPLLLRLGQGDLPLCHVESCAEAILRAAEIGAPQGVAIYNLVDDALPERARYLRAISPSGWPRLVLPLPWRPLPLLARALPLRNPPGLLQAETLLQRFRPLQYSNQRAREALGWQPAQDFEARMARSLTGAEAQA